MLGGCDCSSSQPPSRDTDVADSQPPFASTPPRACGLRPSREPMTDSGIAVWVVVAFCLVMFERPLLGRVALVAGATRGAGRAIAVELARGGCYVYATGRSSRTTGPSELGGPETIEETGELIAAVGGAGSALVVDNEDTPSVAELVSVIDGEHGRLDVLVNDIFGGDRYMEWDKPLWEHDWAGGLRMLQMGVHTHLITCRAAIPLVLRPAGCARRRCWRTSASARRTGGMPAASV